MYKNIHLSSVQLSRTLKSLSYNGFIHLIGRSLFSNGSLGQPKTAGSAMHSIHILYKKTKCFYRPMPNIITVNIFCQRKNDGFMLTK